MKATTKLLVAALSAAGLALAVPAQAAGGHSGGGHWSGGHSGGHWSGGHWSGGHHGGRHWSGGHWYPYVGFYWGAPLWGWGWPYYYGYYDYYYPAPAVIYRDVEPYPEGEMSGTQVQPGPGAPAQGPTYMNYCESAKAYYPKVTTCPEGWRLATPAQ